MTLFFEELRKDKTLAKAFAKAVGEAARAEGYQVTDKEVLDHFLGDKPQPRPLPPDDGPRMTTMAMGEEEHRIVSTGAMGEEDHSRRTTGGIGEESGRPRPPTTPPTGPLPTAPPSPPGGVTSLALGEEGKKPPRHRR
jgi:hypothetical protein